MKNFMYKILDLIFLFAWIMCIIGVTGYLIWYGNKLGDIQIVMVAANLCNCILSYPTITEIIEDLQS